MPADSPEVRDQRPTALAAGRGSVGANRTAPLDCLVVDDEPLVRLRLEQIIRAAGHRVTVAADGEHARTITSERRFDVVISDIRMPGIDGTALFQHIRQESPRTDVILMTAYAEVSNAILALKQGAYEYLTKPINGDTLLAHLSHISERIGLQRGLSRATFVKGRSDSIIGSSPSILRMLDLIDTIGQSDASVLITGESGTGKELVAQALQASSRRRSRPFLSVNCAAFPEGLLEAELFGHERGAFTNAVRKREGRFKGADGGTIFLDEIGEMALPAQAKLLRVLQEGTFEPLGTNTPTRVDVRVISATNQNLSERISNGLFRHDLYYRLKVIEIAAPPLREHRSDLPLLFAHFAKRFGTGGVEAARISPRAWAVLAGYSYPGNVREFANAIEHASVLARGATIDVEHLPVDLFGPLASAGVDEESVRPLALVAEEFEREYLLRVLKLTKGKRLRTAKLLGMSRRNLWVKLRKHGISDFDPKE